MGKPKVETQGLPIRRQLEARTAGQSRYLDAIRQSDLTVCVGPAGTGKTFLAAALGVQGILAGRYDRIIAVRPLVPCDEDLGFLPGDIEMKVDPYMQPVYEAIELQARNEAESRELAKLTKVIPLAVMRGITFRRAFVIFDEAQNCTRKQMTMFLSRLGEASKLVVSGDPSQCDLDECCPCHNPNGLDHACDRISGRAFVTGRVSLVRLGRKDIVRHGLVGELLDAMEDDDDDHSDHHGRDWGDRGGYGPLEDFSPVP